MFVFCTCGVHTTLTFVDMEAALVLRNFEGFF